MSKERLHAKLEAMKELKSEYFIGSFNAFYYLKAWDELEEMRKMLLRQHPAMRDVLTTKRLAWLLEAMRWMLQGKLNILGCRISTPDDWSCMCNHFVAPLMACMHPNNLEWGKSRSSIFKNHYDWQFDISHVSDFLGFLEDPFAWQDVSVIARALDGYLDETLESGHLLLESLNTGRHVTKAEFCEDPSTRLNPDGCEWELLICYENHDDRLEPEDHSILAEALKYATWHWRIK